MCYVLKRLIVFPRIRKTPVTNRLTQHVLIKIHSHLHVSSVLTARAVIVLNSVRQHNCFIIQRSYIGYMFRLIDQSSSGLFSRLSHKVLCTHWDPSVFTSEHTGIATCTQHYMFRLIDQSYSGLFSRLSHKVLCTHWDPSMYTAPCGLTC